MSQERALCRKRENRLAQGYSDLEADQVRIDETIGGLFLPMYAPIWSISGDQFQPFEAAELGYVGMRVGEGAYEAARGAQWAMEMAVKLVEGATKADLQECACAVQKVATLLDVGRTRTLAELEELEISLGRAMEELVALLHPLVKGIHSGALHCRDAFQGAA